MDFKKDKKLFFQLIFLIFPFMIFTIELISFGLKKFGKSIFPERTNIEYSHLTSDMVNGIRFLEPESKSRDQKNVYIENSSSVRDFLTVEEICNAITKLAKKNKRGIYNICSSNGVEIIKIVNFLNRFKRKKIKIISNKKNDFLVGDNSKIKKVGFKPSNKSWKLIINSFKKVN